MERISLGNGEFEGRNNAYLFQGERPALVDTGLSTPDAHEELVSSLSQYGVALEDIELIVLTHWHPDHAGLSGAFQRESRATVKVHAADADLVSASNQAREKLADTRDRLLDEWGTPPGQRDALIAFMEASAHIQGEPPTVEPLSHGEKIQVGDEHVEAIYAPGHTVGHTCFSRSDGTILTGDALLPHYTPNIGGADPRVEDPLGTYIETLTKLMDASYERAYPGHRNPIDDPNARAVTILEHHDERAHLVFDILEEMGPADAWTVSAELFGDLEGVHIIHGPGEAYAHLEHMRRRGLVDQTDEGYVALPENREELGKVIPV